VKLPEPAPDWCDVLARNPEKLPSLLTSREARECVEKANLDYLHWEKAIPERSRVDIPGGTLVPRKIVPHAEH
jgi:hypothetical protein